MFVPMINLNSGRGLCEFWWEEFVGRNQKRNLWLSFTHTSGGFGTCDLKNCYHSLLSAWELIGEKTH